MVLVRLTILYWSLSVVHQETSGGVLVASCPSVDRPIGRVKWKFLDMSADTVSCGVLRDRLT